MSAGGYHHHIGLNTWESLGGSPPAPGTTGLYHLAIRYPTRASARRCLATPASGDGIELDGASDHGVSEALYLHDPDDNGVELYWDRPQELWPRTPDGQLAMFTRQSTLQDLLATAKRRALSQLVAGVSAVRASLLWDDAVRDCLTPIRSHRIRLTSRQNAVDPEVGR